MGELAVNSETKEVFELQNNQWVPLKVAENPDTQELFALTEDNKWTPINKPAVTPTVESAVPTTAIPAVPASEPAPVPSVGEAAVPTAETTAPAEAPQEPAQAAAQEPVKPEEPSWLQRNVLSPLVGEPLPKEQQEKNKQKREELLNFLRKQRDEGKLSYAGLVALSQMEVAADSAYIAPAVIKTGVDTLTALPELAGTGIALANPELYNYIVSTEEFKNIQGIVESITPDVDENQELMSEIMGYMLAAKAGQKIAQSGVDFLVKKFGSKGRQVAREMERALGNAPKDVYLKAAQGTRTLAGLTGGAAGAASYDLAGRQPDEVFVPVILEMLPELSAALQAYNADPENETKKATFKKRVLEAGAWFDRNIPDQIKEAAAKLEINPDDTEAQKKVKQVYDAYALYSVGTPLILAAAVVKYGPKGLLELLAGANKAAIATAKGAAAAASKITPEPIKNAVGTVNTLAGKALASTAGLPKELAEAARQRGAAAGAVSTQTRAQVVNLKQAIKRNKTSDADVAAYMNDGIDNGLPGEVKGAINDVKKTIEKNQAEINRGLGLTGRNQIGAQYQNGEVYFTRTYSIANDPAEAKRIMAAIKNKDVKNTKVSPEDYRRIDNAEQYLKSKIPQGNMTADEYNSHIKGVMESIINRVRPTDKGVLDSLFSPTDINGIIYGTKTSQKVLKGRKDISEPIRDLLGETKDPLKKAELTLLNQNKVISEVKFLNDIDDYARANIGKEIEMGKLIPGLPGIKTQFTERQMQGLTKPMSELSEEVLGKFGTGRQLLRNIYTSPVMARFISDGLNLAKPTDKYGSFLIDALGKGSSLAQATYTALDTGAYALNTLGAATMLAGNGYLFSSATPKAAFYSARQFIEGIKRNDKKYLEELAQLKAADIVGADITGRSIAQNANVFNKNPLTTAGRLYGEGMAGLGKVYSQPDNLAKIIAFKVEQANLKKIFPKAAGQNAKDYEQQIFDMAAERVRNTMPTYTVAAPAARALSRFPLVGQYPLFFTELMRTSKNTATTAFKDLREGLESGNDKQVLYGLKRLTALGTTLTAPELAVSYYNDDNGITNKQQQVTNFLAPDWAKSSNTIFVEPFIRDDTAADKSTELLAKQKAKQLRDSGEFLRKEGESEADYIKRSEDYALPIVEPAPYIRTRAMYSTTWDTYDAIKRPVRLLLAKYANGEDVSDLDIDNTWKNVADSLGGQFVSPKFITEGLIGAAAAVNPRTGQPLYSDAPGQDAAEKIGTRVLELASKFEPQTSKQIRQYIEALNSEEIMGIARGERANGFPLNSEDIVMSMATGVRPSTINIDKAIAYKLGTDLRNINQIDKDFLSFVSKELGAGVPYTPEKKKLIVDEYKKAMDRKREATQKLSKQTDLYYGMEYTHRYYGDPKNKKDIQEEQKEIDAEYLLKAITDNGIRGIDENQLINVAQSLNGTEKRIFMPSNIMPALNQLGLSKRLAAPEIDSLINDIADEYKKQANTPLFAPKENE